MTPFVEKLKNPLTKQKISVLQINLGKRCNLACSHCHVEASPGRSEEMTPEVCEQIIELIARFPQIKTVDLTGALRKCSTVLNRLWKSLERLGKR